MLTVKYTNVRWYIVDVHKVSLSFVETTQKENVSYGAVKIKIYINSATPKIILNTRRIYYIVLLCFLCVIACMKP